MTYELSIAQKEIITCELIHLAECSKDGDPPKGYTPRICFDLCLDDIREASVKEYFPTLNIPDDHPSQQDIHDSIQCYLNKIVPTIIKTQDLGE